MFSEFPKRILETRPNASLIRVRITRASTRRTQSPKGQGAGWVSVTGMDLYCDCISLRYLNVPVMLNAHVWKGLTVRAGLQLGDLIAARAKGTTTTVMGTMPAGVDRAGSFERSHLMSEVMGWEGRRPEPLSGEGLTGMIRTEEDLDKGIHKIIDQYHIPLVFATFGPDGSRAYCGGKEVYEAGFLNPNTIETTGAGDTFCASALLHVLKYGIEGLNNEEHLHELLTFANAAASLVTTKKGALCVMPTVDQVEAYIKESGR